MVGSDLSKRHGKKWLYYRLLMIKNVHKNEIDGTSWLCLFNVESYAICLSNEQQDRIIMQNSLVL